jgi:glutamyl-tRNA reductase
MRQPRPQLVAYVAAAPDTDAPGRSALLPLARAAAAAPSTVLFATCHRVELYAAERPAQHARLVGAGLHVLEGEAAVRRMVEVAVGLGSAVLAEDQVIHQLRVAVAAARAQAPLDRDLGRALDAALRAGRLARSWRPVGQDGPGRSLADAALARAASLLGPIEGRRVLIVGAGPMGEASVVAARSAGGRVALASPSVAHAPEVAARHGVETWPIDPGLRLEDVDLVVVALAGSWDLGAASRNALARRPLVVDLSMPPAVPVAVRKALGGRLVDIDGLAMPVPTGPLMQRYRSRLDALADRTVAAILADARDRAQAGVGDLARRIEDERRRELDAYLRRRPQLDDETRAVLDEATRELAARLFRVPLERLAQDPSGERRRAAEDLFGS